MVWKFWKCRAGQLQSIYVVKTSFIAIYYKLFLQKADIKRNVMTNQDKTINKIPDLRYDSLYCGRILNISICYPCNFCYG